MVSFRHIFHHGKERDDAERRLEIAEAHQAAEAAEAKADVAAAEAQVSQEFLDRFPGGMFRYPAEGNDTLDCANAGLLHLFGCEDVAAFEALTGNTFSGLVYEEDRDRVQR